MGISVFPAPSSAGKTVKGQYFTSNSNWTAPTGVNYVTVTAAGGGGGGGGGAAKQNDNSNANNGGFGGDTKFGTNLLIAKGGAGGARGDGLDAAWDGVSANANSSQGGTHGRATLASAYGPGTPGMAAVTYYATVAVTPGSSYAVDIGAGGTGGNRGGNAPKNVGGDGGSGWLSLEWEE